MDNDGAPDLFSPWWNGPASLLWRNTGNDNHYIKIAIKGKSGHTRIPFGATVRVKSEDLIQTKMIKGWGDYEVGPIIFGLGDRTKIDLLEIIYPDGKVDRFGNITAVDRMIKITEGMAIIPAGKLPTTLGKVKYSALYQNYPNPFNPETWIPFALAEESDVVIRIYDIQGNLVRTLSLGRQPAGVYLTRDRAISWDGCNSAGECVGSGVYFSQLQTGNFSSVRKMVIQK